MILLRTAVLWSAFLLFAGASFVHSQDDAGEAPQKIQVPDAGFVRKGRLKPPRNGLIAKVVSEGSTTYSLVHKGEPAKVIVRSDGSIEVTHTIKYRFEDMEKLRSKHPGLYMHLRAFPRHTAENWPVQLDLQIASVCAAKNKAELKRNDSVAYGIYQEYVEPKKILITVTPRIVIQDE